MGEEEKKKAGGEEKKGEETAEEAKKAGGEGKKEKAEKGEGEDEKKKEGGEDKKPEDGKDAAGKDEPPAPPRDIVLRVYMHCEGCSRKVKKCLRGFTGVEDVNTDCKTHTVVVKGEKADPVKVVERVQRKSHRHVELLSPIPEPPSAEEGEGEKKPEEEAPKPEEKKEERKVITVVLKVHMHCEACAQEIKKRIERMKEVEMVTPDLKSSEVSVKGTFDPAKLVEYVYKRTGKQAVIVKQDPEPEKTTDGGGDNKEAKDGNKKAAAEKKGEGGDKEAVAANAQPSASQGGEASSPAVAGEEDPEKKLVELKRNEYMYNNYPPRYAMEMYHAYPPQIFSDENPNACSIM